MAKTATDKTKSTTTSVAKKRTAKKPVASKTPTVKKPAPKAGRTASTKVAATAAGKTKIASPKAGAKRPSRATTPDKQSLIREAALLAAQYAIEKKATEVRLLDLGAITSMTDFFVIASGDSDRQVKAIAEGVITGMRDKEGMSPWRSEGWDSLKWIIIDFVDFVVHVFQSESRAVYNLERLWGDAPTITIEDTMTPAKPTGTRKKAAQTKAIPAVRVISAFKEVGGTKR